MYCIQASPCTNTVLIEYKLKHSSVWKKKNCMTKNFFFFFFLPWMYVIYVCYVQHSLEKPCWGASNEYLKYFHGELFVCLFYSGFKLLSTIFQPYRDSVWMWQGAQCSLLECCLAKISCPRHLTWYFTQSNYTDTELTSSHS